MTLLLSNEEIDGLLSVTECLSILDRAYREFDAGDAISRNRSDSLVPADEEAVYSLKSMDGVLPSAGVGAVRVNSDILHWPQSGGGGQMREKLPRAGGRWVGLMLLFSTTTGEPLLICPDGVIQRTRVAVTSALAMRELARTDVRRLGLIGCGWQAGSQLAAALSVRSFESVRCFSPTRARREAFAAEWSDKLGQTVVPVASGEEAVRGADVIVAATNAVQPVLEPEWIHPGMHVGTIKLAEMPMAAMERFDVAAIHSTLSSPIVTKSKGLRVRETEAAEAGAIDEASAARLPQLTDLLTGRAPGRTDASQATCFLNNSGLGLQFAAVGARLHELARERGVGRELPTEWFTEDVHP